MTNTPCGYIVCIPHQGIFQLLLIMKGWIYMPEKECPACHRTKKRSDTEIKNLMNRLNRIEGQIRGIKNMLENDAYCPDILTQSAAVSAAMNAFNRELLSSHIHSCVVNDIRAGNDETVDELMKTIQKLMK